MREIGCADFLINSKTLKKNAEAFFRLTYWEMNPDICKEMLELLLNIKIDRIEMPEAERTIKADYDSRGIHLDVYVKDGTGAVSTSKFKLLLKRSWRLQNEPAITRA